jgi:hypothetical protein
MPESCIVSKTVLFYRDRSLGTVSSADISGVPEWWVEIVCDVVMLDRERSPAP